MIDDLGSIFPGLEPSADRRFGPLGSSPLMATPAPLPPATKVAAGLGDSPRELDRELGDGPREPDRELG